MERRRALTLPDPCARASGKTSNPDALLAVSVESSVTRVEDLPESMTVACTDDSEVNMVARIRLEPADLPVDALSLTLCDTYVLVARKVL